MHINHGYQAYLDMLIILSRYLSSQFTAEEYRVMLFINDRTLRFGFLSFAIPHRNFQKGVHYCHMDGHTECIHSGFAISDSTLYRTLKGLHEKEWITLATEQPWWNGYKTTNVYAINLKKVAETATEEPTMPDEFKQKARQLSKLRIGKKYLREKNSEKNSDFQREIIGHSDDGQESLSVRQTDLEHKENTTTPGIILPSVSAASRRRGEGGKQQEGKDSTEESLGVAQIAEQVRTIHRTRRAARAAPAYTMDYAKLPLPFTPLEAVWRSLLQEHYPSVPLPRITRTEYGIYSRNARHTELNTPPAEFFEWVVYHWVDLSRREFKWLRQSRTGGTRTLTSGLGDYPDFAKVARFYREFVKVYANHLLQRDHAFQLQLDRDGQELARLKRHASRLESVHKADHYEMARLIRQIEVLQARVDQANQRCRQLQQRNDTLQHRLHRVSDNEGDHVVLPDPLPAWDDLH